MAFTTVLFDLDGTLIDSIQLILDSYHHTLAVHRLPARTDAEWLAGLGTPLSVQFRQWSEDPDRLAQLIATYRQYNLSNHDTMVTAYPGVVEMVGVIRRAGLRTGLVTSKNRTGALRGLRRTARGSSAAGPAGTCTCTGILLPVCAQLIISGLLLGVF